MNSIWWQDMLLYDDKIKKSLHYSVDSYQIHFPVVWLTSEQELTILMVLVLILMYVFVGLPFTSLGNISVADAVGPCPHHLPLPLQWTLVGIPSASTCISSPEGFWPAHLLAKWELPPSRRSPQPMADGNWCINIPAPTLTPVPWWDDSAAHALQSLRILRWD